MMLRDDNTIWAWGSQIRDTRIAGNAVTWMGGERRLQCPSRCPGMDSGRTTPAVNPRDPALAPRPPADTRVPQTGSASSKVVPPVITAPDPMEATARAANILEAAEALLSQSKGRIHEITQKLSRWKVVQQRMLELLNEANEATTVPSERREFERAQNRLKEAASTLSRQTGSGTKLNRLLAAQVDPSRERSSFDHRAVRLREPLKIDDFLPRLEAAITAINGGATVIPTPEQCDAIKFSEAVPAELLMKSVAMRLDPEQHKAFGAIVKFNPNEWHLINSLCNLHLVRNHSIDNKMESLRFQ